MARIRSIHPGLFTDEAFMTASTSARLLIVGIWTEAWDDGVFEWKPVSLKARLFPADNVNIASLLSELSDLNFIREFSVGDRKYGAIRNFRKFQRPKKPNSSDVLPDELRIYVAIDSVSSPPVTHQFGSGSENPPQMEGVGCRLSSQQEQSRELGVVPLTRAGGRP